ncbi:hypothetical protein Asp14428_28900 [Actinoplanes sp. NBRC 14428]|uniref:Platelet-activating factor acetylhydrolase isoform II n=1 Tax=Pseudosporangium ferrugineum TaxID=439699 RepID=A0A2T0RHJ2_9ACTN|nr:alpha/beta fold hydrolase [Pseudosporangium ferrugineum]PRY20601.1 platelet-activating factor acetylhydrolase isoform II [Pseudosporangium ferrugineum]BCJ51415.1 hypothetical protein Asp14428_28900 [Actinoplanes sp. NBRC 14428]
MSTAFTEAGTIPVNQAQPVVTYSPVVLDIPGRPAPLEIKVSWPATGDNLPVLVLSHGHGASNFLASNLGYEPLATFFAAHGFVVLQPTHLDAVALGLRDTGLPDAPLFWRDRALDVSHIIDRLADIEAAVSLLAGRIDRDSVVAVGHSLGGNTVSLLLGARMLDPQDDRDKDLSDARIKAGVVIGAPGIGDEHLASWAAENYPILKYVDFSQMTGTGLVVAGTKDLNLYFSDRVSYRSDAYTHSPGGNKTLLTIFDAEHIYGGVSGYDAAETSDENPERVATLRALIWAYLRSQLYADDPAWKNAVAALEAGAEPWGTVETK